MNGIEDVEAVATALAKLHGDPPRHAMEEWGNRARVAVEAVDRHRATGDLTRLDMHPDDLLGNENTRALCAHHLGQETPVTRPTLLKWRRERGFPEPLPCGRAGVELWDARQVRVWVQEHAANLPKHRPANLRNATGT